MQKINSHRNVLISNPLCLDSRPPFIVSCPYFVSEKSLADSSFKPLPQPHSSAPKYATSERRR